MTELLWTLVFLSIIVLTIYLYNKPSFDKLKAKYSSLPEYNLYYHTAIELPYYVKGQQSPSFAKDQIEQRIFYSTVFKALLGNNCLKSSLINPKNMYFVCLTAEAAAKAIEDHKGSIREQYNFACASVCLLAKKGAFEHNFEDYCSHKITEILENQINVLSIFDFRRDYYSEDLQVKNRNPDLTRSHYEEMSLKAAKAFIKDKALTLPSWFYDNDQRSSFNQNILDQLNKANLHKVIALIEKYPEVFWKIAYVCAKELELQGGSFQEQGKFAYEVIIGCVDYNCIESNSDLSEALVKYFQIRYFCEQAPSQEHKDLQSKPQNQTPAQTLSNITPEPLISDLILESRTQDQATAPSVANMQEVSSTLDKEHEQALEHEQEPDQEQELSAVYQSEEQRIKSAYENLSSNREEFAFLDLSNFDKQGLEALQYLEKNIKSLSRAGLSNMSDNIKKPLEEFVSEGLMQRNLYEAAQKIEEQDDLVLQTIYAFSWAMSHINPNRYEQQIFTLEAIIGCLYFKCFDDAYSSTAVIKSYLSKITEPEVLNDKQNLDVQSPNTTEVEEDYDQDLNSSDIDSPYLSDSNNEHAYEQDNVNGLKLRDRETNKVVYMALKQFTAELHNYIDDVNQYSLQKNKAMEQLKNLSSIVSLSESMLEEDIKNKLNLFVSDKLYEYDLCEDAQDTYFHGSLQQQVVNSFAYAMFLVNGDPQAQMVFALEGMLICCYYEGFETIDDYINIYLSEMLDYEDELGSDTTAKQSPASASQENSDHSNQELKDRVESDKAYKTTYNLAHEQDEVMTQSSISEPDSSLKHPPQVTQANTNEQNIAPTSNQLESNFAESSSLNSSQSSLSNSSSSSSSSTSLSSGFSSSSSLNSSSSAGSGLGASSGSGTSSSLSSGSGTSSSLSSGSSLGLSASACSGLGASSGTSSSLSSDSSSSSSLSSSASAGLEQGNSDSLASNIQSEANSSINQKPAVLVRFKHNHHLKKQGSLSNLGLSDMHDKTGQSITHSAQKPYKYLYQRQQNEQQPKNNDLDTQSKPAPRVFSTHNSNNSLYEDISNDIRASKGYNTTTFRPKQNLEVYAPSESEVFKLSNSKPTSKKHDVSNIRRLCIEENRTPSWFRRNPTWFNDNDYSIFVNWLNEFFRDQYKIDFNHLSDEQQQLIVRVALGLAASLENAGGERDGQMFYIKSIFKQLTREQILSFTTLQDYLDNI